jgi:NADPH:quinone reductase-like Zn-dependent oxidoreductase
VPCNTAAWLIAAKFKPLEVKPAPYIPPTESEMVVKNAAVSINPKNWKLQDFTILPFEYPTILGSEIAGTVEEVDSSVSRFKKGDRVLGHAMGLTTKRASDGAFQEYTVVPAGIVVEIPSTLAFERAVVLRLTLSTAVGLFQKGSLELQYPSVNPKPTGKSLLVWGGAFCVGSNAIQLAVAADYEVITTASPKNFEYTKSLGASQVFDYNGKIIADDLVSALKGKTIAGVLDCIGENCAIQHCLDIVVQCEGNKFVSTALPPQRMCRLG